MFVWVLFGCAAVLLWVFAGRSLSLLGGRWLAVPVESQPVAPFRLGYGTIALDGREIGLSGPGGRSHDIHLEGGADGRWYLAGGGKAFPLGRVEGEEPEFPLEPGDEAAFTSERSWFAWPTPLELNFITGQSSSWRRHLYYRLDWKKPSGARLEMLWRFEEWRYGRGWTGAAMHYRDTTGLVKVRITPAR